LARSRCGLDICAQHDPPWFDGEWSELVEGKGALALVFEQVLDAGQLLLAQRIG